VNGYNAYLLTDFYVPGFVFGDIEIRSFSLSNVLSIGNLMVTQIIIITQVENSTKADIKPLKVKMRQNIPDW
jgi:hypothetical protein